MSEEIKEIISQLKEILNRYPDKQLEILLYVFGRDNIMDMINEPTYEELQQENQKYKEVFDKLNKYIKLLGKYDGEKCTRGFSMMTADFNKLLDILKEVE